ncbi:UNVERIFIED_CONTAM: hypothetical protein GTU68_035716 [Idotea baltica]|nr:hypothetical protein [Idotea baltica]
MASESNDFALVRPPGHHAFADRHSGFCFFNNVSIAAERLRQDGKRVLILDFDGHLGDGTSDIFYESSDVLYWSLHQFPAFPGNGRNSEIGRGAGLGYNVNVPLPPESGDDIFMHAFKSYLPIIEQFQPDVIAVSAGFDAHRFDPLLQLNVTVSSFFEIGRLIREQCNHIFAVLEGGYNKDVLPRGVYSFMAGINGEQLPYPEKAMTSRRTIWEAYELDLHLGISNLVDFWKF